MAYTAPYIDDAGLHIPSYVDIRDDLVDQFKQIYGQDIYLENDSQDYQMISAFALKTYDTMQLLQIVYNNRSPKTAVGTALDSIVKLNGIARKAASYSTCVVTLTGDIGTVIPAGVVEDDAGNKWDLPANIRFDTAEIEVTAKCETIGAIEAMPGTITEITNPQKGWISVTNTVPAVVGEPVETDEQLRYRQSISVAIPSQNMVNSTIAGIASVTGVTRYKVYDNDTNETDSNGIPGHSIAAVVEGGLDEDVAEQIYLRKGPGGGTYGTTSVTYINADGLPNIVRFFRPTYVPINVTVTVKKNGTYTTAVVGTIKNNVEQYINALDIGYDVLVTGILTAVAASITNVAQPEFSLQGITIGKAAGGLSTADIDILYNEVASVGTVTITEVS
ncbi:baseplate J/gp47 family protein [uncultured Megasphaera sp.]|uniref:baseplate J/gp47 family protein n=1 Tax=uncultured Megasphaera sp. TaxID=165188 RepID=UPI00265CDE8B|nr:baseplate J/gp47 family protein [uncultured Megasphaera sp.]